MNPEIEHFTWRLADFLADNYKFDGDTEFAIVETLSTPKGSVILIDTTDGRTIRIDVVDIHPTS